MPDYSKSKIYKIIDKSNNDIYIGSTVIELDKRLNKHVRDYNRYLNGKMNFISSFDILKNNNFDIELIILYPCNSRIELMQKENEYLQTLPCINRYKSYRTIDDLKAQVKKDNEKYKLNNPEKYKEHQEQRKIKIECEICKSCITKRNMARHKKLHIINY
jgi:hypothetical protein